MMLRMAGEKSASRFTESLPGRLAGWILAMLWVFSMSGVDAHAFSSFPVCVILGGVLLLFITGLLAGRKLVQMSALGWCSLAAGAYFLVRCLNSYAVVDSWGETVLILGAVVYYVAGVYAAQNRSYSSVVAVLVAAVVLNMAAFWVVRQPWFCLEWTGRAAQTPEGGNTMPCALFGYKNFAGVFFCVSAWVLGLWAVCQLRGVSRWLLLVIAVCALGVSTLCGTRAIWLLSPVCLAGAWGLVLLKRYLADQKIGSWNVLAVVCMMVSGLVLVGDLLIGHHVWDAVSGTDSHLRFLIWSSVCEVLPVVPLWGCGANATVWEIVPVYNEWQLPNYAHNEYLQLWVDYGLIGLVLALLIIVLHLVRGACCLASQELSPARHGIVIGSMLLLGALSLYAVVDFPWHSFAFVSLCAFAAGVLASPFARRRQGWGASRKWAAGSHAPLVGVRALSIPGRVLFLLVAMGLLGLSCWQGMKLEPAWRAQWQYNDLSKSGRDADGALRKKMIASLMPEYPSPALADVYHLLPPDGRNLAERVQLLRTALAANPKQLFTAVMLADALVAQKNFAEAEALLRSSYTGNAMRGSLLSNWPAYYAYNLLLRGRHEMQSGHHALALSMMQYALNINKVYRISFDPVYRKGLQPWKESGGVKPGHARLIQMAEKDVHLLRLIGTIPDDSWQQPMSPGGKPALYQAWQNQGR